MFAWFARTFLFASGPSLYSGIHRRFITVGETSMANSKQRRTARRQLQSVGLGWLLTIPAQLPKNPLAWWRKIPKWVRIVGVVLSVAVVIAEIYPWLSVRQGLTLDPNNAYSTLWDVVNGGYIPITNLTAVCAPDPFSISGAKFSQVTFSMGDFADVLSHDGFATIPCFHMILAKGIRVTPGERFTVIIQYAFLYLNIRPLRRSQTFRFQAVQAADGTYHWIALS